MIPFIHIGPATLGTFGLMLWLAAVCATLTLHFNLQRNRIDADALNIVAFVTIAGVLGAKAWHELEDVPGLVLALHQIAAPGIHRPLDLLAGFLHWFQAGFAWFGGMIAGIATLLWQGRQNKLRPLRMLDLAAPAAAVGYGVGRLGCFTSGDGDYGIVTKLPWGVAFPNGLVPTAPGVHVHPTPIYELIFSLALAWYLWQRGKKQRPIGWITGEYLVISGIGRFLVEIIRINPKIYWGMSNAQVAALGSVVVGSVIMLLVKGKPAAEIAAKPEVNSVETT
ncbi:MAG TPA: prolipoprotein diacylglyceryl transferase [Acidobacteriaceae bacterium]